jgi:hypothetical protein
MRFKSLTQRDPVAPDLPKLDGPKGDAVESSPASEPARR